MDWQNSQSGVLELYAKLHGNEAQRGRQFEHICKKKNEGQVYFVGICIFAGLLRGRGNII